MDFMRYAITKEGREVVISGRITDPVSWDFWIRFDEEDVPGLVRVATNRSIIGLVARRWFKKLFLFWRRRGGEAAMKESPSPAPKPRADASEDK